MVYYTLLRCFISSCLIKYCRIKECRVTVDAPELIKYRASLTAYVWFLISTFPFPWSEVSALSIIFVLHDTLH